MVRPRPIGAVPPHAQAAAIDDRALQSERASFAAKVDVELRLACRSEAAMRRELGCAARVLLRRRLYRRLGFVRLSDYARERLGVAGRTLEAAAWLATRLEGLPAVARAYDRSELSWTQARALCKVASAGDEEHWLEVARRHTVDELERLAERTRRRHDIPPDPEAADGEIDGEPAIRWRFACPARVRAVWRRAVDLASRVAGQPLAPWQAAEIIAAEGFSGRPSGASIGDRALLVAMRRARRTRRDSHGPEPSTLATDPWNSNPVDVPKERDASNADEADARRPPGEADAFALDAQLHAAMGVIRTADARIGRLVRVVVDHRLYRALGYARLEDYVRERLGLSMRKVWALAKVERATARSDEFARAYREGRVSWVQALTLLPVLERATAGAWVARADTVTVRRLADEVSWVLEARDVSGTAAPLAPPPLDSRLTSPAAAIVEQCRETAPDLVAARECRESSPECDVHIGARSVGDQGVAGDRGGSEPPMRHLDVSDAEIAFMAPASVVALLRDVLDAFAPPGAPRWRALERLLHHVVHHWERTPRHPDPIFARDGWRCTVPACSSRRNLHDHHITFRSRGGRNTRDNRTAVCAAHHLHGLHAGTIRASGTAPGAIAWELGVRHGAPPWASYLGDRRCPPPAPVAEGAVARAAGG